MLNNSSSHQQNWTTSYNLALLPSEHLERIDGPDGRLYILPDGTKVPSVTTVLSRDDEPITDPYVLKLGVQARQRGELMHSLMEQHLLNQPPPNRINSFAKVSFGPIKKVLQENIKLVAGVELRLWSSKLKAAGTADALIQWRGDRDFMTILDLKNLRKDATPEKLDKFLYQSTAYAIMAEERFGIPVGRIIILISVDHVIKPVVINRNPMDYKEKVFEIFSCS